MIHRRDFIRTLAALAASCFAWPRASAAKADRLGQLLPLRPFGKTGASVTMLGLGGYHVGQLPKRDAQAMIERSLELGIRFFDTAESYQRGGSEERYGEFLTPKYRDDIFLMTKTMAGDRAEALRHLDGSLTRLRTDRLDLWQVHSVNSPGDADNRKREGVFDAMAEALSSGKTKYIGFTGHRDPAGMSRVLELSDAFHACQMPVNALDPGYASFITGVMPTLSARGTAVLAMKTLANGGFFGLHKWGRRVTGQPPLVPDRISLEEALHFVWSLPVATLITGPDSLAQLEENTRAATTFKPMDQAARDALFAKISDLAGNRVEYYKA